MRIAIDATVLGAQDTGLAVWLRGLVRALARVDKENEYVVYHRPEAGEIAPGAGGKFCFVPVRLPARGCAGRMLWRRWALPRRLARDGIEVLHCPSCIAPRTEVPTVLTVHELLPFTHPRLCRLGELLEQRALLPGSIRRAATVHCTSRWARQCLTCRFPKADPSAPVVRAAADDAFRPSDPADAERYRRSRSLSEPPFLMVGSPEPRKNLPVVLEAMALLARRRGGGGRRLVLVGPPGRRRARVERRIRALGLERDVQQWGYLPRDEMPRAYGCALALLEPAEAGGLGLSVMEAMACGTPVITACRGPAAECAGQAAVLVRRPTPEALAEAMERVETDEPLRKRLKAEGIERAGLFGWEDAALHMIELYTLARRTPGPLARLEVPAEPDTTTLTAEAQP